MKACTIYFCLFFSFQFYFGNNLIALSKSEYPQIKNSINTDSIILRGVSSNNNLGISVSNAGDVNGDGYSDVIVGAYGYNSNTGRAYIYYGGLMLDTIPDVILSGELANNFFGYSVSGAGDVNGDGYDDVVIGAYGYNSEQGRAYIFHGAIAMDTVSDLILSGETTSSRFGWSVACAGSPNGDGYSDIVIGAYEYASNSGRAYLFYGSTNMNTTPNIIFSAETPGDQFGVSVTNARDVNDDGYNDIMIGANTYGLDEAQGRAYIYYGGINMNNTADVILSGEGGLNDHFGWGSTAGDVNNDGYDDVIVGAPQYSNDRGKAYIYLGGSNMNNVADIVLNGEQNSSWFGWTVAAAGDINEDGFSDVIVGAHLYNNFVGRTYIFYGGLNMNNTPDIIKTGVTGSSFGVSVASAGDFNGDGNSDVIIGSTGLNNSAGAAHVYFFDLKVIVNLKVTMEGTYNQFFNLEMRRDTVAVQLRNSSSPYNILDSHNSVIDSVTFSGLFSFSSVTTGRYYIVVKHFQSVDTWSKSGGDSLLVGITPNNYDFTTSNSQAYGNNLKLRGSKYCLFTGDVDQNGFVDVGDIISIYNKVIILATGYYLTEDLNGDEIVDVSDLTLCYNNAKNLVGVITP